MTLRSFFTITAILVAVTVTSWLIGGRSSEVDYNADVKPILNKNCMGCHGGVKKAGDVSFLFEHEMLEPGKSGKIPVVRGDAHASEMIRRIITDDPDEKMPKNAPPLSDEEVNILKDWIDRGAKWEKHWSYKKIERPEVPSPDNVWNLFGVFKNRNSKWAKNEIDHFVLDKLDDHDLAPSRETDRATLLRRVCLDLTGLPPTEKEVADFQNDKSPNAYEKIVDQLLQSNAYGEKWAAMWMDLARYADTKGYERDGARRIWRYRDYVIKSFNKDKPFDQFTVEQLAGDLLGEKNSFPSEEQLTATGFHRNTMNNDEGGTVDEEFRVAAQLDRVGTTWEVWQGTTFACIQCHSHPYDPISHDEYYKYMAYFNNTRDEDVPSETPTLRFYKNEDSLKVQKIVDWVSLKDKNQAREVEKFLRLTEPKVNSHDFRMISNSTLLDSKYMGIKGNGTASLSGATLTGKSQMLMQYSTKAENAVLTISEDTLKPDFIARFPVPKSGRDTIIVATIPNITGKKDLYFQLKSPKNPEEWVSVKWIAFQKNLPGSGDPDQPQIAAEYMRLLGRKVEETPVLWEGEGDLVRKTNVFVRGNWLVKGAEVKPDVPAMLPPVPKQYPQNRLGLARWMTHRDNPLTSRVIVNRFWEQLFGRGIVETVEDFGSQGSEPSHQELLDWLAVEFMEKDQWSVKKLLKRMVMSATYRQNSAVDERTKQIDPANMWLSHASRVRLSAEQIRDQALAVSGLLSTKMYGKSVMPPQPDGIWQTPYNGDTWVLSEGEDKYRRALYTYWKRSAPYPSMMTFDSPTREFCQSRRIRTNTPLQALNTLNDPVFLEAAETLAVELIKRKPTAQQQLTEGYRLLSFKSLDKKQLALLMGIYHEALKTYQKQPGEMKKILVNQKSPSPELAALTVSTNVLLNLDNVLTKE
ncbi:DUF1553 domain-containing protein [Dyadobacter aurulentus]|uniref:DUF1553 domain-containing protein n=1 Tax=Dyadobacter sp. UC 10 TaxID=2605428 RepID=UPI0011F29288|nr:DUF1553 domain-containing protein [Dyadobacter sp. UC 10]KAA0992297.1 DUF1553 domain-containing protein [Dyadobacter sp. UC 10]